MTVPARLSWRAPLAVLASAALFYFGTGLHPLWPLTWLAAVPVLAIALELSPPAAFLSAALAMALGALNEVPYFARLAPIGLVAIVVLVPSVAFGACALLFRAVARRRPLLAALAFACGWTAFEYLVSFNPATGTAGSIAYSQSAALAVVQVASLTGIWGISFLVMLVASSLALAAQRPGLRMRAIAIRAATLAAGMLLGMARLASPPRASAIRVGLAASDSAMRFFDATGDTAKGLAEEYALRVDLLAAGGASFVVLPEKSLGVTGEDEAAVLASLSGRAREHDVVVVAGLNRVRPPPARNVAAVLGDGGKLLLEYDKKHLVPGFEAGYARGREPGTFESRRGRIGVAICKDLDFPASIRRYGRAGVSLMLVPAWDFGEDGEFHARMAMMRGVENGFSLARAAARGRLTVSDDRGRVMGNTASDAGHEVLALYDTPPGAGGSLYARWGDWLAWVCLAATLCFTGAIASGRMKHPAPGARLL